MPGDIPRPSRPADPGDGPIHEDPPPEFRVAALGDSLVWGQGLKREDRFVHLFTTGLSSRIGKRGRLVWDSARSGAQIDASSAQRQRFIDTYPGLFPTSESRDQFFLGVDESPARGLYGELPSTFPTILGQVDLIPPELGESIDVVLLDGGVNDLPIEDIVNPQSRRRAWMETFESQVHNVGYGRVLHLLERVRRKCPKAVVLYFGFFPPISYSSSPSQMRDLFQHEYDSDIKWWLNEAAGDSCVDVDPLVREAMTRAVWMFRTLSFWTRKAVTDANGDSDLRGGGFAFVSSGFGETHSAFTLDPFLFEDYDPPTKDPARQERMANCPRLEALDLMRLLHQMPATEPVNFRKDWVDTLLDAIDGPTSLVFELEAMKSVSDFNYWVRPLLAREIARIQRAEIASVSHPNEAGARSYAQSALSRYADYVHDRQRAVKEGRGGVAVPQTGGDTLDKLLQRCNLRSPGPVLADLHHLTVDVFSLRLMTSAGSPHHFHSPLYLGATLATAAGPKTRYLLLTYLQNSPKEYPTLEPGAIDRLCVDTRGSVRLEDVLGLSLHVGNPIMSLPSGLWGPERIAVEVNGVEVTVKNFSGAPALVFGKPLDLEWPSPRPAPEPAPQVLKEPAVPHLGGPGVPTAPAGQPYSPQTWSPRVAP